MIAANDNLKGIFCDRHYVVFVNRAVLMFDKVMEAKEFIDAYYKR